MRALCAPLLSCLIACGMVPGDAAPETPTCRIVQPQVSLPIEAHESSGAAISRRYPGVVWTHNDAGGEAEVFAVDAMGRLRGRVRVSGSTNVDWEDIALGPCSAGECLYIGDIGDNDATRSEIILYRVAEPDPAAVATAPAERFTMRYLEGPRDAEALFVLPSGEVFVVSKGIDAPIALYRYPLPLRPGETVTLEQVVALSRGAAPRPDQVTGADATPDGLWVAIRTYSSLLLYRTQDLLAGPDRSPIHIDLTPLGEPQGEAVAINADGTVVLTSEGGRRNAPGTLDILSCALGSPAP